MDEQVSVVIPVYNDQANLQNAINDIINQTYSKLKIIIVNDGSNDSSGDIAEAAARADKRVTVIHKDNGGTGSALNAGFTHVSDKYATWASSDDRKNSNFISTLVDRMRLDPDIGLCFSAYYHHAAHKQIRLQKSYLNEHGIVPDYMSLSKHTYISGVCFMYNMIHKNLAGEFATTAGEDYLMAVKIAALSKVAYIDDVLGEWTNNPHGLSARLNRPNHGLSCAAAAEAMAFARAHAK